MSGKNLTQMSKQDLQKSIENGEIDMIKEYLSLAIQDQIIVNSRSMYQDFIDLFQPKLNTLNAELSQQVLTFALDLIATRAVAFEEQVILVD
jgi:hypothetical protein